MEVTSNYMTIIGITGTLGAGKGTVVEYLVKTRGFKHYSARALIADRVVKLGLSLNRNSLNATANALRKEYGDDYIVRELYKQAESGGGKAIIESLHTLGEVESMKKLSGFTLLAVDAPIELRYQRIIKRKSSTDFIDFEKFQADQDRESSSVDKSKSNLLACITEANFIITNNGTLADLEHQIDEVLEKISV